MDTSGHFSRHGVYSEDCARYEHSPPAPTSPFPPHGGHPNRAPVSRTARDPIDVIKYMTHETHNDARAALPALLAGAEDCGPGARSAGLVQDDELADFLCKAQYDITPEAKRLLAQRVAE